MGKFEPMYAVKINNHDNLIELKIIKIDVVWHRLDYSDYVVINKKKYDKFFPHKYQVLSFIKKYLQNNNKVKVYYTIENNHLNENITNSFNNQLKTC
ncbi:MAG: hypothetical protein ACOC2W_01115 [bacterium]